MCMFVRLHDGFSLFGCLCRVCDVVCFVVYVCVCVCACLNMLMCVGVCVYMFVCVCVHVVCMWSVLFMYVFVGAPHTNMFACVCVFGCVCVCVIVCVCMFSYAGVCFVFGYLGVSRCGCLYCFVSGFVQL